MPSKGVIHLFLPESKNFTGGGLAFGEEIFEEFPYQDGWRGTTRFAPYFCDAAIESGREPKSYSESNEP